MGEKTQETLTSGCQTTSSTPHQRLKGSIDVNSNKTRHLRAGHRRVALRMQPINQHSHSDIHPSGFERATADGDADVA